MQTRADHARRKLELQSGSVMFVMMLSAHGQRVQGALGGLVVLAGLEVGGGQVGPGQEVVGGGEAGGFLVCFYCWIISIDICQPSIINIRM